jgi:dTMP kinase
MMRGRFITVEGVEGAGKSTLIDALRECLEADEREVMVTREPGGTRLGEALREVLLDNHQREMVPEAELLLMFAARVQHVKETIRPALDAGTWVICDRFTDATYAYQGYGRRMPLAHIRYLEEWLQEDLRPDLTVLLDLPVETGLARTDGRGGPDRFESEADEFFERVREGYLEMARAEPERFRQVDASRPRETVREQAGEVLRDYLAAQQA